jgi:thymidylate kinase
MDHSTLLQDLFRLLDERAIAYCVVGDWRDLPKLITGDVDLVVEPAKIGATVRWIHDVATRAGARVVQCLEHEQGSRYLVIAWTRPDGQIETLAIDVCGDYFRVGRRMLRAHEILAGRRAATGIDGRELGFTVPVASTAFIYYLVKRVDKRSLNERQGEYLTMEWRANPEGAVEQLERFWGPDHVALLARASANGEWGAVRAALPQLRTALRWRLTHSLLALAGELRRRWHRVRSPTGLLVAVLGADGSGKSSVIAALASGSRPEFRRATTLHLRPRLASFARKPQPAVTRPHAAPLRGRVLSTSKVLFFTLDYLIGYWVKLRPGLVRSTLILCDRYFDDLLIDPRRYRYGGSPLTVRRARRFVPRPDLWLVLDAPVHILQARKCEVSSVESARQREGYLQLAATQKHTVVLDSTQPLVTVVEQARWAIMERLSQRTARRMGFTTRAEQNPVTTRALLFFCRHRIPALSRFMRVLFNCDIYCELPPDLLVPHPYGIVIHSAARLGARVTIMQQVTIGSKDPGASVAPVLADDVYVGAGARILGAVRIGEGAVIGANAVVTRDVPAHVTVVGANRIVRRSAA